MAAKTDELSDASKLAIAEAEAEAHDADFTAAYETSTGDDDFVVPPSASMFTKPANERTEEQLRVDATVEKYHEKWIDAGKIDFNSKTNKDAWNQSVSAGIVGGYWLLRGELDKKKKDLKAAASRLGYTIRWGGLAPRPPHLPQDGRVLLSFVIKDVDRRGPRATTSGS